MADYDATNPDPIDPRRTPDSRRSGSAPSSFSSAASSGAGRFGPGAVLNDRYRIVSFLGRGGMGEVYRADDLKLEQPVALKFLPPDAAVDGAWLARFHSEVRLARQVSHRHVCRVYDVGELERDGARHPFLSMEYVDGEDLASLLRRIGRMPRDKAVQIARQLCAGLAAAHDSGVIHRDLKPANIMLDGRGDVRITDFGVAALAEELEGAGLAGTPAYMSPEQVQGGAVTVRSDVYSLGLVLYELFTGRRAIQGSSLAEIRQIHETATTPAGPGTVVEDMDPVVERVIMRCLSPDPADRPASALAVAAALPGGDPLAAALAAGETPSPEMVAASGGVGALSARAAWGWIAAAAVLVGAFVLSNPHLKRWAMTPMERAPAVLEERANEILDRTGHGEPRRHSVRGIESDTAILGHIVGLEDRDEKHDRLSRVRPAHVYYFKRWSNQQIINPNVDIPPVRATLGSPPLASPGEAAVSLDMSGRLRSLRVIEGFLRDETDEVDAEAPEVDWSWLFEAAGLTFDEFEPAEPNFRLPATLDEQRAWRGALPEDPEIAVSVEAAQRAGRIVHFRVLYEWETPEYRQQVDSVWSLVQLAQSAQFLFLIALLAVGVYMAFRNIRLGRGDRRGAIRLGMATMLLFVIATMLRSDLSPLDQLSRAPTHFGPSFFVAAFAWGVYLGIEPLLRRLWPQSLTAWTRLLSGRWRDPYVGRSVLVGIAGGAMGACIFQAVNVYAVWRIGVAHDGGISNLNEWLWVRESVAMLLSIPLSVALNILVLLLVLAVLRTWLRSAWLWAPAFLVVATLMNMSPHDPVLSVPATIATHGLLLATFVRHGALAAIVFGATMFLLRLSPLVAELDDWRGQTTIFWMLIFLVVLVYGYTTAVGRTPAPKGA
ncbi:MAG: serine/threonine protein kinase [Phycisphaeraceae bacterium]|nr:MAG: serine/threonine protein kinase [Phycisphaeraceae bacterium]